MGECAYTLTLSDTEEYDEIFNRYDGWECHRDPHDNAEYCIFHLQTDKKSPEATTEAFLDSLQSDGREANNFIGAKFTHLDLSYLAIDGADNYPIVLHGADIGRLSFRKSTITHEIRLTNGSVGKLNCYDATFEEFVNFNSSTLCEPEFDYATIESTISAESAHIGGFLRCKNMDVTNDVRLSETKIKRGGIADESNLRSADFGHESDLRYTARYDNIVDFEEATIGNQLSLANVEIDGTLLLSEADIGELVLNDAKLRPEPPTDPSQQEETVPSIGMTDTHVENIQIGPLPQVDDSLIIKEGALDGGEIRLAENGPDYIFYRGKIGDLAIRSEINQKDIFDRVRFQNTRFDEFEFADYTGALSEAEWEVHVDPALDEAAFDCEDTSSPSRYGTVVSTYLRCKNGAKQVGNDAAAAEFFMKEKFFRGRMHASNALAAADLPDLIAQIWKAISNILFRVTAGYGERPSRTILSSVITILIFGGIYAVMRPELPYQVPLGYVVYSFESFVALVIGQPESTDPTVSLVTAIEGFLGTFFIALFVFTLTRSINR